MGGVILLLMITVVLCIVILCIRSCQRKGTFSVNENVSYYNTTNLNTDVTVESYPLYDIIKSTTMDNSTIKLDSNPSYNILTKPCIKASKDSQPNELIQHNLDETIEMETNPSYVVNTGDLDETMKMETNPSYGINTGDLDGTIQMEANPSYGIHTGDLDRTVKMDRNLSYGVNTEDRTTAALYTTVTNSDPHDYDYCNDDHFLHEDTATNIVNRLLMTKECTTKVYTDIDVDQTS